MIKLIGTGLVPQMSLSPNLLTFASQIVGTSSSPQVVTVTNTGRASFTISNISMSGDFSETNNCLAQLSPAGGSCAISVVFTPTASGNRTGTLTIVDTALGSPHTVNLSGTGSASLGLSAVSGGSSRATVTAGNKASYALSLGGAGISGTASLSCTGDPQGATCSVPASVAVSAGTATNFTVSVSTTSRTMGALRADPLGWLWAMAILGWVFVPYFEEPKQHSARRYLCLFPLVVLIFLLSSCGSSSGSQQNPNGTPAGSYTLTVTTTVGSSSQSMPLTLQVQ